MHNVLGVALVLLIFAKLTGYVTVSWWLVFAPLWIGAALVAVSMLTAALAVAVAGLIAWAVSK